MSVFGKNSRITRDFLPINQFDLAREFYHRHWWFKLIGSSEIFLIIYI